MKQTAVEWLKYLYENQGEYEEFIMDDQWKKALEMEKGQMIDFTMDFMGEDNSYESYRRESALDLFNKTFNTNG